MTPWFALALTMIHTIWIGTAIGIAAFASRLILGRASASLRYVIAILWLLALAITPLIVWMWVQPAANHSSSQTKSANASIIAQPVASNDHRTNVALADRIPSQPMSSSESPHIGPVVTVLSRWDRITAILPGVWLAGSMLMLCWSLIGLAGAERLRRNSKPVGPNIQRVMEQLSQRMNAGRVQILSCTHIGVPLVIGILRPAILIPPALLSGLSTSEIEMILLHELAHIRRWDNPINLAQRLIESILFFHPAVWAISAWVRQERENCCDDFVMAALRNDIAPSAYASLLVRVHALAMGNPNAVHPLANAVDGGDLVARVRRIVTRRDSMRLSRSLLATLAACAIVSVILLARWIAAEPDAKVITVAKQGGQYTSIQAAIDAAPDRAIIRIAPGTWQESVKITKPITLEGAGWDKTILSAAVPAEARQAAKELAKKADENITPAEWKAQVDALSQKFPEPAVIRVEQTHDVIIRGLKAFGSAGANPDGVSMPDMGLIMCTHASALIDHCAAAGSPGQGIQISGGSDVQIRGCLVCGVWGTGVRVGSRNDKPAKVLIDDSDVRNCYYTAIVLGPGTDGTITHCRLWGTGWHGIRYDNASPTIKDNRIFNVARSGIYASGETHATITGNLFLHNGMDGISCWFANQDTIKGNTFASNQREGLAVMGASDVSLTRNLFVGQPVAIVLSKISGNQPNADTFGHAKLDANWFWKNDAIQMQQDKNVPLDPASNSHTDEVQFTNADKGDYSLPPNSPARAAKIGVADPLAEASPYPMQPEEKAIAPDGGDWDYQKWKK